MLKKKLLIISLGLLFCLISVSAQEFEDFEGKNAIDFTLKSGEGKNVSLKDLKGNVVVLDFWATWCGPCKQAMPGINSVSQKLSKKAVKVFGVNAFEQNPKDAVEYMKKQKFTYGLLLEGDELAGSYGINAIPAIMIIDKKGKVAKVFVGFSPDLEKELEAEINKLL